MAIERRAFLRNAAVGTLALLPLPALAQDAVVTLVADPTDPVADSEPGRWAAGELRSAMRARGLDVQQAASVRSAPSGLVIVLASTGAPATAALAAGRALPEGPEAMLLMPGMLDNRAVLLAAGSDALGLVYAATELAERVRSAPSAAEGLELGAAVAERPANRVRSVARFVTNELEDRGWLHDRQFWHGYLTMLAGHRFNGFSLTLGIQYDYPQEVSDVYFYFAYPFLLKVPGYDVVAAGLPDDERDRNLETLRFIARETARRGLRFRLGIWTHAYAFDSPRVNYRIAGITAANHAAYCRDALAMLLREVPDIAALTFRLHGESGIREGDLDFWRTVFAAIPTAKRPIALDLHPKGIDARSIALARETGMLISISPKYMGEHMGLPYHQAAIRQKDMPPAGGAVRGAQFALSEGSRSYTRYSYGDFMQEGRDYDVVFRLWPGTQRLLLWGDPRFAAGFARHAGFCGAGGLEICEPLSFRGRKGTGRPGNRTAYADAGLAPRYDWQKAEYTYRLFGRLLYWPDAPASVWQRPARAEFGAAAGPIERALASASRILPLMTMAHAMAAANNLYWPEIYTNMPIVQVDAGQPFSDTIAPQRFGTVEPFDPQIFQNIETYARSLLAGQPDHRVSPAEVAAWLDGFAAEAEQALAEAVARRPTGAAYQRAAADVTIQVALGRFFAHKLRAGVLWEIHTMSDDAAAAAAALSSYQEARAAWVEAVQAGQVYVADITFGSEPWLRGHWSDRLSAIDADIAQMARLAADTNGGGMGVASGAASAVAQALSPPPERGIEAAHTPPGAFRRGQSVALSLDAHRAQAARLHVRHVNQSEAWQEIAMDGKEGRFTATIPAAYTDSPFPLQYFFAVMQDGRADMAPGLGADLCNQPYHVLRQA
jgi:hypothetical protein